MEKSKDLGVTKQDSPEALPSPIRSANDNQILGFDNGVVKQNETDFQFMEPGRKDDESLMDSSHQTTQSISISMPQSPSPSPSDAKRVLFKDGVEAARNDSPAAAMPDTDAHSAMASGIDETGAGKTPDRFMLPVKAPRMDLLKDTRYNSFKTWSGRLERQLSTLRGKSSNDPEINSSLNLEGECLPVDRYFDALEGPELETLKPLEDLILPEDMKWPFLLRFPISSFGMCLGVGSQAIMWKFLASTASTHFLHICLGLNYTLWCISIALFAVVASTYLLKLIFYFEAVRREYYHPIRVNFFFAPWIALLFLAIGVPDSVTKNMPPALWYVLMAPIFCLELKIYGQWMSGGQRRLSKVANPSNHLAVVGNFVGALLGASMGLKEGPIFFFAVGLAHYTVLFVTLYQRLPTNQTLPKELHPVFFLFVAAPSVASMAWATISGSFDNGARVAYFISLFLYFSLAVRVNFFTGFKFSLAWWAYTVPMTGAAIATIRYSSEVSNIVTKALYLILSTVATVTVTVLLITTMVHAFILRDLFPNDIGIAISDRKTKPQHNWFHRSKCGPTKDADDHDHNSGKKEVKVPMIFPGASIKPISVRVA